MRRNKKYAPDLNDYMSQCEMNYALVLRVMRFVERQEALANNSKTDKNIQWGVDLGRLPCEISITDEAKYTTTLSFKLSTLEHPLVKPVTMSIRLYHDAAMAEVLEHNRNHSPAAKNDYPEQVKHYPDDKHQRNRLLQQSLVYCLENPLAIEDKTPIHKVS